MHFHRIVRIAGHALFGLAMVAAFAGVFGWVAMLAWNFVVPDLTGLPALGYPQAVAGLVLMRILTGRFTHFHGGQCRLRRAPLRRGRWGRLGRDYRPDTAAADSAGLYSAWWESEGEAAFQAFVARHVGEDGRG